MLLIYKCSCNNAFFEISKLIFSRIFEHFETFYIIHVRIVKEMTRFSLALNCVLYIRKKIK